MDRGVSNHSIFIDDAIVENKMTKDGSSKGKFRTFVLQTKFTTPGILKSIVPRQLGACPNAWPFKPKARAKTETCAPTGGITSGAMNSSSLI